MAICQRMYKVGGDQLPLELAKLADSLSGSVSRLQAIVSVLTPEELQTGGLHGVLRRYLGRISSESARPSSAWPRSPSRTS